MNSSFITSRSGLERDPYTPVSNLGNLAPPPGHLITHGAKLLIGTNQILAIVM